MMTISANSLGHMFARAVVCLLCLIAMPLAATPEEDGEKGMQEFAEGNLINGMELMRKAAEAGYAPAQARLAYVLDQAEEDAEAVKWFQKAAEQANSEGMFGLGSMYNRGDAVEKNPELGFEWFLKAAEQNYIPAMRVCAYAYEEGNLNLQVDYAKAVHWFSRAAALGDQLSIQKLAKAYETGQLGLVVDAVKSAQLSEQVTQE